MDNNSVEQNIRNISHEINNGLSICEVYTQIVRKTLEKENYRNQSVANALNCIEQSIKIIGSEISLLRSINSERSEVTRLNEMINEAIKLSSAYIKDKKIEFVVDLGEDVLINTDICRFKAVLINLFKNAVEAISESGYIFVETRLAGEKVLINIGNSGAKISKTNAEKMFTKSFTTKKSGSGIGLFMCRETVENYGGTIKLLSSTSKKTVFQIEMPIQG